MRKFMAFVMLAVSFAAVAQDNSVAAPKLLRAQDLTIEVESEALQRQYIALQAMRLESVEYSRIGSVRRIVGDTDLVLPSRATDLRLGDSAGDLLLLLKDLLLARGTETLRVTRHDAVGYKPNPSTRGLRLSQEIGGIPVVNSFLGISYDDTTKEVSKLVAIFVPDRGLDREPRVSVERAEQVVPESMAAMKDSDSAQVEILEGSHLAYYHTPVDPTPPRLVWVVRAQVGTGMQWAYYVDAINGALIDRAPLTANLTTKVYNANGAAWSIPGQVPATSMTNAQIAANPMAQEAKNHVVNADTKLRLRFPLPSSSFPSQTRQIVNYGFPDGNAQWLLNGSNDYLMYSGPRSGPPATISATTPADNTAHEYTHGIVYRQMPFVPDLFDYQYGAIREGFSDIGAATVQIATAGVPSTASWRMGEGFFVSPANSVLRSMANPADAHSYVGPHADWYPLRLMTIYSEHYNSTILSHAYYLTINGGLNAQWLKLYIPEITVPAIDPVSISAENYARQIFVKALDDDDVAAEATLFAFKKAAMDAATALYPLFPARRTSVQKAFEALGVGYQCSAEPATAPNFNIMDLMCAGRYHFSWPSMPGVNRYIAQVAPQVYGWSFAHTITDGDVTTCQTQIQQLSMFRGRACNNCGCGPWSETEPMYHWPGQCP